MSAHPCAFKNDRGVICAASKNHPIHLKVLGMEGGHLFMDASDTSLKHEREGVRNWREQSGYNGAVQEAKDRPCQIASPVCTGRAEHLHEPLPRGRAGGLKKAVELGGTVDACDACNDYCSGEGMEWARIHGFLFSNTIEGRTAAAEAKAARNLEQKPPIVKVKPDSYAPRRPSPIRRSRLMKEVPND